MRAVSLFSGSCGNCTYIDLGKKKILIDAGGSAKAIVQALCRIGSDMGMISDIFITHEHSDHTHALNVLLKKYPVKVHITESTAKAMEIKENTLLSYCAQIHGNEFEYELFDGCLINAFSVPHDSKACVGYKITNNGQSIGIATDLGYVTQRVYDTLCGCRAVMIEANHDTDMVREGNYPQSLKARILSGGGHLSNTDCAEICAALARKGTASILLSHLSKENNTPVRAYDTVYSSIKKYGVKLAVADRDCPTELEII